MALLYFVRACIASAVLMASLIGAQQAGAQVNRPIDYTDRDAREYVSYFFLSQCQTAARREAIDFPTVLILHQWKGVSHHETDIARRLSADCMNAYVVDLYGSDSAITDTNEARRATNPFIADKSLIGRRLELALDALEESDIRIDSENTGLLGYGFGGTMILDYLRNGGRTMAASVFHAPLAAGRDAGQAEIDAPLQVHIGHLEASIRKRTLDEFRREMNARGAPWQIIEYAGAGPNFTLETAERGYSMQAAEDGYVMMSAFFKRYLSGPES